MRVRMRICTGIEHHIYIYIYIIRMRICVCINILVSVRSCLLVGDLRLPASIITYVYVYI